jgi:23S rRNA pseudouridine955/2504/2580 synthase
MMMHIVDVLLPTRLDRYLRRIYQNLTQGTIEKMLRTGDIKVNNKKTEASFRVVATDVISLPESLDLDKSVTIQRSFSSNVVKLAEKMMGSYLIYNSDEFISINKPSGLATQGGSKISLSIDDAIFYLNQRDMSEFKLVHRLDKETSGVFLIAKNYLAALKLTQAFKDKIITKTYLAVTLGKPLKTEGEISNYIAKNRNGAYEIVQEDLEFGKLAVTKYELIKSFGNVSLIKFTPLTGRMHQLRLHSLLLGCPIIGDSKYGNNISSIMSKKMLLHAKTIILPEQIFGKEIKIESPLPVYFNRFLDNI